MVSRSGSMQRKGERVYACDAVAGVMVVPSTKELDHAIDKETSASNDGLELSFRFPDIKEVMNQIKMKREVGEFLSGALAGAMSKAVLAPLETISKHLLIEIRILLCNKQAHNSTGKLDMLITVL